MAQFKLIIFNRFNFAQIIIKFILNKTFKPHILDMNNSSKDVSMAGESKKRGHNQISNGDAAGERALFG